MDKAIRILVIYLGVTLLFEIASIYGALVYKNNLPVYHLYAPFQYTLLVTYYTYRLSFFSNRNIKFATILLGIILSIINAVFIQNPFKAFNSYYIVFISFTIILLSLYSFYEFLVSDELDINANPHFWLNTALLIYWSFTFFYWVIGVKLNNTAIKDLLWVDSLVMIIHQIGYAAFAVVFWLYPKMKKA